MAKLAKLDDIVSLCKRRGFIFQSSEIYGGLANTWDYGPLGVELKNNIKKAWWKKFVQESVHNVGLDAAILMNPKTWVASGHVGNFNDPMIDCRESKARYRADHLHVLVPRDGEGLRFAFLEGEPEAVARELVDKLRREAKVL